MSSCWATRLRTRPTGLCPTRRGKVRATSSWSMPRTLPARWHATRCAAPRPVGRDDCRHGPYEFSQPGSSTPCHRSWTPCAANGATGVLLTSDSAGRAAVLRATSARERARPRNRPGDGPDAVGHPAPDARIRRASGRLVHGARPGRARGLRGPLRRRLWLAPHTLAALAYDGVRAIAETVATTGRAGGADLTASPGFQGAGGVFRLLPDGTNQRALAIAQVIENQVAIIDPAPRRLGGPGF
jgi:hypothetical protein